MSSTSNLSPDYDSFPVLVQTLFSVVTCIPSGKVASYGVVGQVVGMHPRQVGFWLHRNPSGSHVPCHRVVRSSGELAAGYVFGGPLVQQQMLKREGVRFRVRGSKWSVNKASFISPTELMRLSFGNVSN